MPIFPRRGWWYSMLVFLAATALASANDGPPPVLGNTSPVMNVAWQHHSQGLITTGKFNGLGQWMFSIRGSNELVGCELNQLVRMHAHSNAMAIGGKPERIVVGTNVGTVDVYDPSSLQRLKQFKVGPEYSVYAVAIDRQGKHIAGCRTDGTVLVWNIEQEAPVLHLQKTSREGERMTALAFSPEGTLLATLSRYGFLSLWNLADGQRIGEPVQNGSSEQTALQFTPTGDRLMLIHRASLGVWHPQHEPKVREILPPDEIYPRYTAEESTRPGSRPDYGHNIRFAGVMTLSPDAKSVASITESGGLAIWDLATLKILMRRSPPPVKVQEAPVGRQFERIGFAPNAKRVAACTHGGELVVWDVE